MSRHRGTPGRGWWLAALAAIAMTLVVASGALAQNLPDAPDPVPSSATPAPSTPSTPSRPTTTRRITPAPVATPSTATPSATPDTTTTDSTTTTNDAAAQAQAARQRAAAKRRAAILAKRRAAAQRKAEARQRAVTAAAQTIKTMRDSGRRAETAADEIRTARYPVTSSAATTGSDGSGSAIPLVLLLVAALSGGLALLPGLRRRVDVGQAPRGLLAVAGHRIELAAVSASCLLMALFILGLN